MLGLFVIVVFWTKIILREMTFFGRGSCYTLAWKFLSFALQSQKDKFCGANFISIEINRNLDELLVVSFQVLVI